MIKIIPFTAGPLRTNSYLIFQEGAFDAVLIDAGGNIEKIYRIARENGVEIKHVLLTHGHFDHVGAVAQLQKNGAKIYLHKNDVRKVQTQECTCGFSHFKIEEFTPDVILEGGENIVLCNVEFTVISTPGHTSGSVCYVVENAIFSGDTLFSGSFGRVDLGDGDIKLLSDSIINKLFTLNKNYTVYPGHEDTSELDWEREHNPILYYV